MPDTKRVYDVNGWAEIRDNPILRAGIFEYLGRNLPGAPDPNKVYRVWRPEEELEDPECAASFRLLPWIDEHPPGLLGEEEDGYTPPEDAGVHGTIGERVYYRDGVLLGNIKLFSAALAGLVAAGKKELSPGYRARYEYKPGIAPSGVAKGKPYDVIQRRPRGNHLASVLEGRQGPSVAVLDGITLDAKDLYMADENTENTPVVATDGETASTVSLEEGMKIFLTMLPVLQKLIAATSETPAEPAPAETPATADNDQTLDNDDEEDDGTQDSEDGDGDDKTAVAVTLDAMDKRIRSVETNSVKWMMRELNNRNVLVNRLSPHVGTFDAKDMTTAEVASYGLKKLGISAPKGQEMTYLSGYLSGVEKAPARAVVQSGATLDSADAGGAIGRYLSGEKK
ncbi:DUF2213 domain-containing protein [Entomohabitans teleogrylli]|uniref:DUF2213 domain-containing protein n=1 Tax=Entomohabitans teleogrylli TaxID=1384589 RepID=UPI00073D5241|nr:DUF2213 domain-containing protein [Entomohabitans teleogrylli]